MSDLDSFMYQRNKTNAASKIKVYRKNNVKCKLQTDL